MEEVNVLYIDGEEYIIADEIAIDGTEYIFLSKEDNPLDYMIKKIKIENDLKYVVKLDNEEEFDKAMQVFLNKHKDKLN